MTRMLTKDERHMLSAALGVLRHNVLDQPGRRGGKAGPALYETLLRLDIAEDYGRRIEARAAWAIMLADALRLAAWPYPCRRPKYQRRAERILRARLALAIRAVLRADRGERGAWWEWTKPANGEPEIIGHRVAPMSHTQALWLAESFGGTVRRREALWTTAPGHEAGGEGR